MSRIVRRAAALCVAALIVSPLYAAKPQKFQNSVKYRDAGAKPATGRSGSAAIQARALRGQTETSIEVTTGQFDSDATPAGRLDKVQVKLFASDGSVIVTDNYRKGALSGAFGNFVYDWPGRGQRVQVQANVSGIDPRRTDVVTVDSTVKLRPDLTVSAIQAANRAYVGTSVTIDAVVRETNGDLGARANCMLKVDGTLVDHADGIWVDAGDAVTCEFRQVFTSAGTKQLSVEVTDVVPGDYNASNNSASAAIDIVPATVPVWHTMSAWDFTYDQNAPSRGHEEFTSFDPNYQSYVTDQNGGSTSTSRVVSYGATLQIPKAVTFPVAVESSVDIDGQTTLSGSFTVDVNAGYTADGYSNTCGEEWQAYHWFQVCHFHSDLGAEPFDLTTLWTGAQAGVVTYESWGTSETRYADGTVNVYTFNGSFDYTSGETLAPLPASEINYVAVHGSFTDAANEHYEADASVQLFPITPYTLDYGEYCYSYDYSVDYWGRFNGSQCTWPVTLVHGMQGSSSGMVP